MASDDRNNCEAIQRSFTLFFSIYRMLRLICALQKCKQFVKDVNVACSNRDLSMILGALLKTKSRAVLNDIINKNGKI